MIKHWIEFIEEDYHDGKVKVDGLSDSSEVLEEA
jgi:hypothetical protein